MTTKKTFDPLQCLPLEHIARLHLLYNNFHTPNKEMVKYIEENNLQKTLKDQGLDVRFYCYALEHIFNQ